MQERLNYRALAPDGHRALIGVHRYVAECGLEPELIDLAYLRVSQINGCAYCVDLHWRDALDKGVEPRKLNSVVVWRESPFFSARERAALTWAESLTRVAETAAPDEDYEAVRAQFAEKEVADLTYAIGLMNALNRLAVGLRRLPQVNEAS